MVARDLFKVLENAGDAAFAVDEEGMIGGWNRAAEELLGYTSSEVTSKTCWELFQGLGILGTRVCTENCHVIESATASRGIPNFDVHVKTRSGQRVWVNVSVLAFRDDRTRGLFLVHLFRDSEQKMKLEQFSQKILETVKETEVLRKRTVVQADSVRPLTAKERHTLKLLAEGRSANEVAETMGITPRTLRNHIHNINKKLRTSNRLEAVLFAVRNGLV